jgi:hypothetical protein
MSMNVFLPFYTAFILKAGAKVIIIFYPARIFETIFKYLYKIIKQPKNKIKTLLGGQR